MRIDEQRVEDVTILRMDGEIDARTVREARKHLDGLLEETRHRVVFNLAQVEVINSTTVAFLVDSAKRLRQQGGDAILSHSPPLLERTLQALRISDFFKRFPNDDAAVAHYREQDVDDITATDTLPPPPR